MVLNVSLMLSLGYGLLARLPLAVIAMCSLPACLLRHFPARAAPSKLLSTKCGPCCTLPLTLWCAPV